MVIVEHLENTDKNNEESMKNLRRPHAETPDAPGDSAFTGLPSHSPPRNRVAGPAPCRPRGRGGGAAHSTPSGRSPRTARTLAASVVTTDRAPGDFRRRWLGGGICSGRASGRRWPSCRPRGAADRRSPSAVRCNSVFVDRPLLQRRLSAGPPVPRGFRPRASFLWTLVYAFHHVTA